MNINWTDITLEDLAGYLSKTLRKEGIDLILVGGACVTIYSKNRYQSQDLDFITYEDLSKVKKALLKLGFEQKDKYFRRDGCPWIVEFVSPPVVIGQESILTFSHVKTKLGTIKLLRPVDSVKDRLASFYYWNDREGLQQSIDICLETHDIDFGELEAWSKNEGHLKKFHIFLDRFKRS